jgi:hypothetical protein
VERGTHAILEISAVSLGLTGQPAAGVAHVPRDKVSGGADKRHDYRRDSVDFR